ncbi:MULTISPECIES: stage V sporulation protein AC [Desulfosporosinus]|uniref:Stage V sporulation protein AC n=2 Tax=Desulfosporosinus TaxID=79206 RepID=A0A1M5YY18_9FIRM|nr:MULTISPECIES: stage V sporulation protein AC [Desulfosporosinus]MDA8222116.1 stage V sporulation protein AC [Desulfitobacterium hafniense]MCO1599994.1 stage V sporulation protein AC [Desulfosporosinus nitroreducens]MCO5387958.1 stage V sporulation protein AC [Desulfosporosinus sp.]MDO0822962.1 stage V sporulation protein AC [Desulfosporosinus nitroreducens]SHI16942.1 stage V sporulation protein AC [Desulfosporosinus lacus DSM 15449]
MADQTLKKPLLSVTAEKYQTLIKQYTPKPTIIKNVVRAFIVGGIICSIGQIFINLFSSFGLARVEASTAATATMIFLGALLTGLGVYDEIGKFGGAGSIVPVTGFANSIVAPAMEFKREGYVMGVGAKLFTVAGPVLVYGIATSIVVGFVYFLLH